MTPALIDSARKEEGKTVKPAVTFLYSWTTAGSAQERRKQNLCHEDPEKAAHSGHETAGAHSFGETHHAGGPL